MPSLSLCLSLPACLPACCFMQLPRRCHAATTQQQPQRAAAACRHACMQGQAGMGAGAPPLESDSLSATSPAAACTQGRRFAHAVRATGPGGCSTRRRLTDHAAQGALLAALTCGQWRATASARPLTIPALMLNRSSRVIPGLRGTPASAHASRHVDAEVRGPAGERCRMPQSHQHRMPRPCIAPQARDAAPSFSRHVIGSAACAHARGCGHSVCTGGCVHAWARARTDLQG